MMYYQRVYKISRVSVQTTCNNIKHIRSIYTGYRLYG